jgi:SOS-response transcriptional repressor LexA
MIGERLKAIRSALRLKQIEMAKAMEMNPSAISQMESGRTKPSLETLIEIAQRYRVDLHWLITGEGQMFSQPETSKQQTKGWDKLQKMMNASLEEIVQARQDMLDSESVNFNVSGEIAAGEPLESFGDTVDVVSVRRSMIHGVVDNYIALRVNGRSMEPDIRHHDVVLIRQNQDWRHLEGRICAVRIDGAITLKKLMLDDAKRMIVLVPLNEDYQPIIVNPDNHRDVALIGSLFYLFRVLAKN